jgi:ribose 5-phosphate isomerase B
MKIAVGSDHAGFSVKEKAVRFLRSLGHTVIDCGTDLPESCDYPDYAKKVAELVSDKKCEKGVLICGSGQGMAISANKVPGIRAALCLNLKSTLLSRQHNDSNIFCSGARLLSAKEILKYIKVWLKTGFAGDRHKRRVDKIRRLDLMKNKKK